METLKAKWLEMDLYRRILLAVMLAEIFGFLIANVIVVNRPGLEYGDALLYPSTEGELQVYEGKLDGESARFTVSPEGEISYQWGEFSYGPYQVTVDPAAFPETLGEHDGKYNIGLEISQGGAVLFRGGYRPGDTLSLWDESGKPLWGIRVSASMSNGTVIGEDGRVISPEEQHEPSLAALVRVVLNPELTHRGNLLLWMACTLLALFNLFQICFPHFFFRLSLWGHVRNIDDAEPSDWYIAMENIEWAVLAMVCLALYAMGLSEIV